MGTAPCRAQHCRGSSKRCRAAAGSAPQAGLPLSARSKVSAKSLVRPSPSPEGSNDNTTVPKLLSQPHSRGTDQQSHVRAQPFQPPYPGPYLLQVTQPQIWGHSPAAHHAPGLLGTLTGLTANPRKDPCYSWGEAPPLPKALLCSKDTLGLAAPRPPSAWLGPRKNICSPWSLVLSGL